MSAKCSTANHKLFCVLFGNSFQLCEGILNFQFFRFFLCIGVVGDVKWKITQVGLGKNGILEPEGHAIFTATLEWLILCVHANQRMKTIVFELISGPEAITELCCLLA